MRGSAGRQAAQGLIEREDVLSAIESHLQAGHKGQGGTLLIEGAPGLGKTSLLAHAGALAADSHMRVLRAQGGELEQSLAWGIARQLLGEFARDDRVAVPAAARSALGLSADTFEDPVAVAYALSELCDDLAADRPLILLVDDVHWCDRPSASWLSYLAPRARDLPLVVLLALRPRDPRRPPELATLAGGDGVRAEELRPVSLEGTTRLVRRRLSDADDRLCQACFKAAGGNPFLLSELLRELTTSPELGTSLDVSQVAIERIDRVIQRRLIAAGDEAERLARVLAVFGSSAVLSDAAAIVGLDRAQAYAAADSLQAGGVTTDIVDGQLSFAHPLIRAGVQRALSTGERSNLHLELARRLSAEGERVEQVAAHLLVVEPGAEPWVREQLVRGGDAAMDAGAPRNAVALYQRAIAERVGAPSPDLLSKLGRAAMRFDPAAAEEPLRGAIAATADALGQVPIALDLAVVLQSLRRSGEAVPILDRLGEALEAQAAPRGVRLRVEAELLAQSFFDPKTTSLRRTRLPRLVGTLTGRDIEEALIYVQQAIDAINTGTASQARALAETAWADGHLQELTGSLISPAVMWIPYIRLYVDDYDWTIDVARDWLERARVTGSSVLSVFANSFLSEAQSRSGDLRDAHATGLAAWQIARDLGPAFPGWWIAIGVLAQALLQTGRPQEAADLLRDEGLLDGPPPEIMLMPAPRVIRGEVLIGCGKTRQGVQELLAAHEWLQLQKEPSPGGWRFYSSLVDGLLALDQKADAADTARSWLRRTRQFGALSTRAAAERALALTQTGEAQLAGLQRAERTSGASAAKAEHARTLVELGAALRRGRRRQQAREPLRQALDLATRCGADALAERAWTELQASGARPRRANLTGADALTASERRVAQLASTGLTNREIAAALFISRKTVESHLASIYLKLDVNDRKKLSDALEPPRVTMR